ncbi:hypothetical protein ACFB49_35500 [Sphingomonas sp. DBB INV C78]|uniref:hypothetical protein n=1 Tax=Sphingomonas sp. DBB INV C78 TaxID=3349434 RepID=UPI0036D30E37
MRAIILIIPAALLLSGCIARTAVDIVTLPVKAVGAGVDAMTTSQEEADRNRGREIRKQEEREAKERKKAEKEARRQARQDRERYENGGD